MSSSTLVAIKVAHTVVWALLVGCILLLPATALARRFDWAAALTVIVLTECGVLVLNEGRCPLTGLAARYTPDRAEYRSGWLATIKQSSVHFSLPASVSCSGVGAGTFDRS